MFGRLRGADTDQCVARSSGGGDSVAARPTAYSAGVTSVDLRLATAADYGAICAIERECFPRSKGLFANDARAIRLLDPAVPQNPFRVAVAEGAGRVVGYLVVRPYTLATTAKTASQTDMLLDRVAVTSAFRRMGVGRALLGELAQQAIGVRQDLLVAHVPSSQADFYRAAGWAVLEPRRGLAWIPFMMHIRADGPIKDSEYDRFAYLVLRPRALRTMFEFNLTSQSPFVDAAVELQHRIERGEESRADLDAITIAILEQVLPPGNSSRLG